MTHPFESDFIPVCSPVVLRISGPLPFDVYIQRAEDQFTKLFPKNEILDQARAKAYFAKGVLSLFVKKEDYKQYLLYIESRSYQILHGNLPASEQELTDVVREMANLTTLEILHEFHFDTSAISYASETIQGCIDILGKDPRAIFRILKGLSQHPYMIKHSIYTMVFSLLLAKTEKFESDKTYLIVGLGALLHDIGMSHCTFDSESKSELTGDEWREIRQHPEIGKRLVDGIAMISPEVRQIIMQHHEQPNGLGYPNGIRNQEIFYPAKIVSIADSFSSLIMDRPFRKKFTPMKAITVMKEDRGKFDSTLLKQFSSLFVHLKEDKK